MVGTCHLHLSPTMTVIIRFSILAVKNHTGPHKSSLEGRASQAQRQSLASPCSACGIVGTWDACEGRVQQESV